jgi:hypothetical protein
MTDAVALSLPSFAAVADAVFSYVPHESSVVSLTTWTDVDAPGASVVGANERLWFGAVPLMDQPEEAGLMLQSIPSPSGRASVKVTPVAVPSPVFATVR